MNEARKARLERARLDHKHLWQNVADPEYFTAGEAAMVAALLLIAARLDAIEDQIKGIAELESLRP